MLYETPRQKRVLIITSMIHFANDGVSMVLLSIFPLLLSLFGLAAPELGVVAGMWSVTSVIGSPVVGHLSDRLKRNDTLLAVGLVMMAIGVVGTGWSITTGTIRSYLPLDLYPALLLFAAIGGLGSSVCHPIGGTLLSQLYPPSKIGLVLGLNGGMGSLGRALYPSLVVILISALSLPYGVIALGLLGLLPVTLVGGLSTGRVPSKTPSGSVSCSTLEGVRHPRNDTNNPQKKSSSGRSVKVSVLVLTTIAVLRGTFGQGVVSFLSLFIVEVQHYSFSFGVGFLMMIAIILGAPGQIVFGRFSDLHRRMSLAVNTAGQSLTFVLYLITISNPIMALICLALFGFFTYSSYPVFISAVADAVPSDSLSLSNSIVWGIGTLGGNTIGPVMVGLLVGNNLSLLPTIFLVLAVLSGLSTGFVAFLPRRIKDVTAGPEN
jgi:MFS family permease